MSGGSNGGNSTTTANVPPWLQDAYTRNIGRAEGVADSPFQSYNAPTQGADNSYYADARSAVQGAQGAGQGQTQDASKVYGEIAGQSPYLNQARQLAGTDLSAYTNPYEDQVVRQSLDDIQLQQDRALNGTNASTQRGAFGGARQGVDDSLTKEGYGRLAAQTASGLRQSGYTQAQGLAGQDVDRRIANDLSNTAIDQQNTAFNLQAAQGLLGAGQQQQSLQLNQANALMGAGSQIKQAQDATYGDQYQEFMRQQQDPFQKQALVNSAVLGVQPGAVGSTTQNSKAKGISS